MGYEQLVVANSMIWSAWIPFHAQHDGFGAIPAQPGLYRARPVGHKQLIYIGQTGRSLRERVRTLCLRTLDAEMPYNDPHTAAPNLWAWGETEGWDYEVSVAGVDVADADRQGLECLLLWQYRLEAGESTLANHGRFHPHYSKSGSRASDRRGGRLPPGRVNPAGGPSLPPLFQQGQPMGGDWMGLTWSGWASLASRGRSEAPRSPGVYRIAQDDDVVYVGESGDLRGRLQTHARSWDAEVTCSWVATPQADEAYQRHEVKNDLIGGFFAERDRSPLRQFGRSTRLDLQDEAR